MEPVNETAKNARAGRDALIEAIARIVDPFAWHNYVNGEEDLPQRLRQKRDRNRKESLRRAAMIAALQVVDWQPIEGAPKGVWAERRTDPSWVEPPEVLLLFEGDRQCVGKWDWYYAEGGAGASETGGVGWYEALTGEPVVLHIGAPVAWMSLPQVPK